MAQWELVSLSLVVLVVDGMSLAGLVRAIHWLACVVAAWMDSL